MKKSVKFSVIRWFANRIENEAYQAFWKDKNHFDEIEEILNTCWQALYTLGTQKSGRVRCPWDLCNDGTCAPRCPGPIPKPPTKRE